jgi:hypothetical protein
MPFDVRAGRAAVAELFHDGPEWKVNLRVVSEIDGLIFTIGDGPLTRMTAAKARRPRIRRQAQPNPPSTACK